MENDGILLARHKSRSHYVRRVFSMILTSFSCESCGKFVRHCAQATFSPETSTKLCLACADSDPFHEYKTSNIAVRELGFCTYADYLKSDLWKTVRQMVLTRDGWRCVFCKAPATEVHHQSYAAEVLIGKELQLLHSLCRTCHTAIEIDENGKKCTLNEARRVLRRAMKKGLLPTVIRSRIKRPQHA